MVIIKSNLNERFIEKFQQDFSVRFIATCKHCCVSVQHMNNKSAYIWSPVPSPEGLEWVTKEHTWIPQWTLLRMASRSIHI